MQFMKSNKFFNKKKIELSKPTLLKFLYHDQLTAFKQTRINKKKTFKQSLDLLL